MVKFVEIGLSISRSLYILWKRDPHWKQQLLLLFLYNHIRSYTHARKHMHLHTLMDLHIDLFSALIWSMLFIVSLSNLDKKEVKLASFDSYCAYSAFCLTFRRNLLVFVERKALGMNWRKKRGLTKPEEPKGRNLEEHITVHHEAQPCCSRSNRAREAWPYT